MTTHKFLEFDVEKARSYSQKLFGPARDTIGESYVLQATRDQHSRDKVIMEKLLEVNLVLRLSLENLLGEIVVPDKNCACHISPPCGDCVDNGAMRQFVKDSTEALAEMDRMMKEIEG